MHKIQLVQRCFTLNPFPTPATPSPTTPHHLTAKHAHDKLSRGKHADRNLRTTSQGNAPKSPTPNIQDTSAGVTRYSKVSSTPSLPTMNTELVCVPRQRHVSGRLRRATWRGGERCTVYRCGVERQPSVRGARPEIATGVDPFSLDSTPLSNTDPGPDRGNHQHAFSPGR
ncbi:hypothetical protein J6590_066300 [Homalodisca vitripennis]|nr:hypothetical protein J6590_066300 [Homalodisca vitripennis]